MINLREKPSAGSFSPPPFESHWVSHTVSRALLVAALFCLPFNSYVLFRLSEEGEYGQAFLFELFVLGALALHLRALATIAAGVPRIIRWCVLGFVALVALSVLIHPSLPGVLHVLRLLGLLGVSALVVHQWRVSRGLIVFALGGGCLVQVVVTMAQWGNQSPLGLEVLGEGPAFIKFGSSMAVQGTFSHPYMLAGYCMVILVCVVLFVSSRKVYSWWWAPVCALAAVPLALTYSRMTILGLLLLLSLLTLAIIRRETWLLPLVIGILVGFLIPSTVDSSGWIDRATRSAKSLTDGPSELTIDSFSSGRLTFVRQAVEVLRDEPEFGVGPGLYLRELEARGYGRLGQQLYQVHMVPLVVSVESGLAAGALFCALLVALLVLSVRSNLIHLASFVAFLPFLALDHFPYSHPQGMGMSAVWIALLVGASTAERGSGEFRITHG